MTSSELPPGRLCRAAMYDDPSATASGVVVWHGSDSPGLCATQAWLRAVADAIDERIKRTGDTAGGVA